MSRIRLAAMAVSGVAFYNLVLVAPFALLLFFNPWSGTYGPWPIVGVLVFFWWTLQPFHESPGTLVSRAQAPALFESLDTLADRIGAPRIHEVRLTDGESAGPGGAGGRTALTLLPVPVHPDPITAHEIPVAGDPARPWLRRRGRRFLDHRGHCANRTGRPLATLPDPRAVAPDVVARHPAVARHRWRGRDLFLRCSRRLDDGHTFDTFDRGLNDGLFTHHFARHAGGTGGQHRSGCAEDDDFRGCVHVTSIEMAP